MKGFQKRNTIQVVSYSEQQETYFHSMPVGRTFPCEQGYDVLTVFKSVSISLPHIYIYLEKP
jgi:hypothetical protein